MSDWKRIPLGLASPLVVVAMATIWTAVRVGFVYPAGHGWGDELLDYSGIGLAFLGLVLSAPRRGLPAANELLAQWLAPCHWAVAGGLALILGQLVWTVLFLSVAAGLLLRQSWSLSQRPTLERSGRKGAMRENFRREAPLALGVVALCLLLEMWEDAVAPGGYRAHASELAVYGFLLALICVTLAAWTAGFVALAAGESSGRYLRIRRTVGGGALCLFGFALVACAIRWQPVHAFDDWFVHTVYKSGTKDFTLLMREVSNAGGRDLAVYWVPLLILGHCLARRGAVVPYFAASMLGTLGLEVFFKTVLQRPRPDLTHGVHIDSFPSGHALAATILAGTLLLIWLPQCRRPWQQGVVWAGAVLWPLLVAASRVYLGRHYFTDVLGGILLGTAWVQLCYGLALFSAVQLNARLRQTSQDTAASVGLVPLPN